MKYLLTAMMILAGSAAVAQQNCAPRTPSVQMLQNDYGESPVARGLSQGGAVFEVFANPETGSWTITVTRPDGILCLVASGGFFETEGLVSPVTGEPT